MFSWASMYYMPNKMLNSATKLLQEAAQIFNDVHESFDGITVNSITTWLGETEVKLSKRCNDHIRP